MKKVRIGIIGAGGIARGPHMKGYLSTPECEITAICDMREDALERTAERYGIPAEHCFRDYRDLIGSGLVDAVDICTTNDSHCEIAMAAIAAGLPFSVEKPVGLNYQEVKALDEAARVAGIPSFVCFSWRYRAYSRYMKHLIQSGMMGQIYHIYVRSIKDSGLWPGRRLEWRFDQSKAGGGVLFDLGSHMIDVIRFFGNEFDMVAADYGTYIKERQRTDSDEIAQVTTDDWANLICRLDSGVSCNINVSRCATTISDLITFEVFGEKGRLLFKYEDGRETLEFTDAETKETRMFTPPAEFQLVQSKYFVDLVNGITSEDTAGMEHGLACQAVLDAAVKSAKENRFVAISEITGGK